MKYSEKILSIFFVFLISMMFVKSMVNILKFVDEIKNQPHKIIIEVCPTKSEEYFNKFEDRGYLFALYRYKSMGEKCKK